MTDIASHRGGARLWPENSRLAFRNSAAMAVDFIEFDIHRSRDGVLVVHHDPLLGRTSAGTGAIADKDWSELREVALLRTSDETIPSLDEVLDILEPSGIKLRIELKNRGDGSRYPGIEAQVVESLTQRRLLDRTTFTAFDLATLEQLTISAPATPLIWLIAEKTLAAPARDLGALCRKARMAGVPEIAVRISQAEENDADICRRETIRYGLFAVHEEAEIRKAFAAGVTAFTTDRPDLAVALKP
ncbi:glycerophosphodiester phosphodiesterase family protein [Bosea sp. 2KB_26]|uniref:glycerophosphodiester phosphodiesterase family protein n=1 Tax=Bosea sp. 2KB_26 TaxID=3237475 RepID=UPI003F8E8DE4